MLKIEHTEVLGWEASIRGMRNPMNSWNKSDSFKCDYDREDGYCAYCPYYYYESTEDGTYDECCLNEYANHVIGQNDLDLMKRLVKAGSDHSKFMRMITVYVDVTAPLYWFKEFDTYKVGTVANSCSTMHKIHAKEFTLDDFSHEHLIDNFSECNGIVFEDGINTPKGILLLIIDTLNTYRHWFLETKDKKYWWQMIQLLPSSYNQKKNCYVELCCVARNVSRARYS